MAKGSHKFAGRLGSLKIVIELIFSSLMLLRFLIDVPYVSIFVLPRAAVE